MSLIASLRSRAGKLMHSFTPSVEAPVSTLAAAPIPSRLGALALRRGNAGPLVERPPADWALCPSTGATLPTGPEVQVTPWQYAAARAGLRHGWFASLAWEAGGRRSGADEARARAIAGMESWLRQDMPGQGLGWAHPTDVAVRLVHWHAGLSWLGSVPDELRDSMAGSASWHIQHLTARVPKGDRDVLRRVVHYAGLVIAGFTFPELPNAKDAWSTGLAGLKRELPALVFDDGSPRDVAPLALADALWQVAIARAVAGANGAGFPADADAALARASRFLERLGGGIASLPAVGEAPVSPVLSNAESVGAALWDACLGWGIESGEPSALASPDRLTWLGLPVPSQRPEAPKAWSLRVWREGGVAVAENRIKNRPARASAWFGAVGRKSPLTHPVPMQVLWDVGELQILADPGPSFWSPGQEAAARGVGAHSSLLLDGREPPEDADGELLVGRVDGKKTRIEGRYTGWRRIGIAVDHERDVLFNQARCIITDRLTPGAGKKTGRHAVALRWQLGPGWEVTRDGDNWSAKQAGATLVIQLPSALSWELVTGRGAPSPAGWVNGVASPCFIGNGGIEAETELVTSLEVR